MPIVHTNPANRELKLFLKRNSITYEMLADASGYSVGTIAQWFRHPLPEKQDTIIQQSIRKIMNTHNPPTLDPSCCNYKLRATLMEQGISYSELARKLNTHPTTVREWLIKRKLSPQRRELIENAIKQIGGERRLSHED